MKCSPSSRFDPQNILQERGTCSRLEYVNNVQAVPGPIYGSRWQHSTPARAQFCFLSKLQTCSVAFFILFLLDPCLPGKQKTRAERLPKHHLAWCIYHFIVQLLWKKKWQGATQGRKVLFSFQVQGDVVHHCAEGVAIGAWGSWWHWICNQKAEKGECQCSISSLLFI